MTKITVEDHLESFRAQHGEEAWRAEVQRLVLAALRTRSEKQEAFWKAYTQDFEWLDWEPLRKQAEASALPLDTQRLIAETLKSQMPGIRSQAQYDAVVGAMEAMQIVVNAMLERNQAREQDARNALELSFDAINKATELTLKLEDVPEAASSDAARQFKDAPAQFNEVDLQAELLHELASVKTLETLGAWYEATHDRREKIVSRSLWNALIDAIRAKRNALT